jgi:hypothetical protein
MELESSATTVLRQQVAEGLLYAHSRLNGNTSKTLEATAFLYALVELLAERGLITIDELDARKAVVTERLAAQLTREGQGAMLQDPEYDKYAFEGEAEIDCAERLELCRAACCRLPFALSRQDIREGIIRWELGQPYLIEQGADGYCSHLDRAACFCTVRAQRPVPCRAYDCRRESRIWLDFDSRRVNPAILEPGWPRAPEDEGAAP